MEFFENYKYVAISSSIFNSVFIYNVEEYGCNTRNLGTCSHKVDEFTGCANGSYDDHEECRPGKSFFDNGLNKCLPCHSSCTECTGPLEEECVNTVFSYTINNSDGTENEVIYQIYNDNTSEDSSLNWNLNSICQ
jgi:hypothetical protein